MSMTIIELYSSILESLRLDVAEDGLVSMTLGDESFPVSVSEKRLILPTEMVLRRGIGPDEIAFHPLSESIVRSESPVLKKLQSLVNFRLSEVISILLLELMEIAADPTRHKNLSPKQSEFLGYVSKVDEKTVKALSKILDSTSTTGENNLVRIYLKRGGKWKGEKYSRLAVTSFPITDEFDADTGEIFGVKVSRKKDFKAIESLFSYLIPNADDLEEYSHGSNSRTAPFFDALCGAYIKVAKHLNKVTRLFRKELSNPKDILMNLKWEEALENLDDYRGLIPVLEGNGGEIEASDDTPPWESKETATVKSKPKTVFDQKPAVGQCTTTQAGGSKEKKGTDWNAILNPRPTWGAPAAPVAPWGQQAATPQSPTDYAGRVRGVPQMQFGFGYSQQQSGGWGNQGWTPSGV